MPVNEYVTLNTGAKMPVVGFGTWKSQPGQVEKAVEIALKQGYRHIDTATAYGNEAEVGHGIKASGVPREEFFLTTKLNNNDHGKVEEALEYSLKQLDVPYLDLWLMHWPAPMTEDLEGPDERYDWVETWKKMEAVYEANKDRVKAIGVSNFSIPYLEKLLPQAKIIPAMNQIELHPSCTQTKLREFCLSKGIALTSYSALGSDFSPLLENDIVKGIAEKQGVYPANVLISLWANIPGTTVLSKSVTEKRIKDNFKVVDLSDEDVEKLLKINDTHHFRACEPNWTGYKDNLGFDD